MTEKLPTRTINPDTITEIAMRSKAYWGYTDEFMEACKGELTVSSEDIANNPFGTVDREGNIAGFYMLDGEAPSGELRMLFVDPDYIGMGVGRELFEAAKATAVEMGMTSLLINSDPNAEAFYTHMGALKIGESPSGSILGRVLPKLKVEL